MPVYVGFTKVIRIGRNKLYDGKVKFDDLNIFDLVDEIKGIKLYTTIVNSPCFKRNLRIVSQTSW